MERLINDIAARYPDYQEATLCTRFISPEQVQDLLKVYAEKFSLALEPAGESFEGRPVNLIRVGTGSKRILLWSQMHGDEPSATMALFALLNFLYQPGPAAMTATKILSECTLFLLPMLNPDGAARFTRRNAQGIDINRDFLAEISPESKILKRVFTDVRPDVAFNLHDQVASWSVSNSGKPAAISLLAPASDERGTINSARHEAMQVCAAIHAQLKEVVPGHVGRFPDEYEPRAFGDNFQALGASTILIEGGNLPGDPHKQEIGKLVFSSIVAALSAIAGGELSAQNQEAYFSIPENAKRHFHILLRQCPFLAGTKTFRADLGLLGEYRLQEGELQLVYAIEELGDLSAWSGYEELDARECEPIDLSLIRVFEKAHFRLVRGGEPQLHFREGLLMPRRH
jgi:hypothetical protein